MNRRMALAVALLSGGLLPASRLLAQDEPLGGSQEAQDRRLRLDQGREGPRRLAGRR